MAKSIVRAVFATVGVLGCSLVSNLPTGASTPSAKTLLASAIRDAVAGKSVHEVAVTTRGSVTLTMTNDIATNQGRQEIKLSNGAVGEVLALDAQKQAYIEGNQLGLKEYFGFPAAYAVKYAGKWMKSIPGDQGWSNISGSTTLQSDFGTNVQVGHPILNAKLVTINGTRAFTISGSVAASANGPAAKVTLYVSDAKSPLPLRLSETTKGMTAVVNWSKWGETITLKAPTPSVPIP